MTDWDAFDVARSHWEPMHDPTPSEYVYELDDGSTIVSSLLLTDQEAEEIAEQMRHPRFGTPSDD